MQQVLPQAPQKPDNSMRQQDNVREDSKWALTMMLNMLLQNQQNAIANRQLDINERGQNLQYQIAQGNWDNALKQIKETGAQNMALEKERQRGVMELTKYANESHERLTKWTEKWHTNSVLAQMQMAEIMNADNVDVMVRGRVAQVLAPAQAQAAGLTSAAADIRNSVVQGETEAQLAERLGKLIKQRELEFDEMKSYLSIGDKSGMALAGSLHKNPEIAKNFMSAVKTGDFDEIRKAGDAANLRAVYQKTYGEMGDKAYELTVASLALSGNPDTDKTDYARVAQMSADLGPKMTNMVLSSMGTLSDFMHETGDGKPTYEVEPNPMAGEMEPLYGNNYQMKTAPPTVKKEVPSVTADIGTIFEHARINLAKAGNTNPDPIAAQQQHIAMLKQAATPADGHAINMAYIRGGMWGFLPREEVNKLYDEIVQKNPEMAGKFNKDQFLTNYREAESITQMSAYAAVQEEKAKQIYSALPELEKQLYEPTREAYARARVAKITAGLRFMNALNKNGDNQYTPEDMAEIGRLVDQEVPDHKQEMVVYQTEMQRVMGGIASFQQQQAEKAKRDAEQLAVQNSMNQAREQQVKMQQAQQPQPQPGIQPQLPPQPQPAGGQPAAGGMQPMAGMQGNFGLNNYTQPMPMATAAAPNGG